METNEFTVVLYIILGIYLIITIWAIISFFKLAEDVKFIKILIYKESKNNDLALYKLIEGKKEEDIAILKLIEGKKEEAIESIRKAFILECTYYFDLENFSYNIDETVDSIIDKYVYRYKYSLKDEITKDYLNAIYRSLRKTFLSESN